MTDEELKIKVAELCGRDVSVCPMHYMRTCCGRQTLPDYPHDLNAMREAEGMLTENQRFNYVINLGGVIDLVNTDEWFALISATARQRAEAFIKAMQEDAK